MEGQAELKARLQALSRRTENHTCVDCSEKAPTWATLIVVPDDGPSPGSRIGAFCCYQCSASHRNLGTHICFVRSIELDEWREPEVVAMESGGNNIVNAVFEAQLSGDKERISASEPDLAVRTEFIQKKYEGREFYDADAFSKVPPPRSPNSTAVPPVGRMNMHRQNSMPSLMSPTWAPYDKTSTQVRLGALPRVAPLNPPAEMRQDIPDRGSSAHVKRSQRKGRRADRLGSSDHFPLHRRSNDKGSATHELVRKSSHRPRKNRSFERSPSPQGRPPSRNSTSGRSGMRGAMGKQNSMPRLLEPRWDMSKNNAQDGNVRIGTLPRITSPLQGEKDDDLDKEKHGSLSKPEERGNAGGDRGVRVARASGGGRSHATWYRGSGNADDSLGSSEHAPRRSLSDFDALQRKANDMENSNRPPRNPKKERKDTKPKRQLSDEGLSSSVSDMAPKIPIRNDSDRRTHSVGDVPSEQASIMIVPLTDEESDPESRPSLVSARVGGRRRRRRRPDSAHRGRRRSKSSGSGSSGESQNGSVDSDSYRDVGKGQRKSKRKPLEGSVPSIPARVFQLDDTDVDISATLGRSNVGDAQVRGAQSSVPDRGGRRHKFNRGMSVPVLLSENTVCPKDSPTRPKGKSRGNLRQQLTRIASLSKISTGHLGEPAVQTALKTDKGSEGNVSRRRRQSRMSPMPTMMRGDGTPNDGNTAVEGTVALEGAPPQKPGTASRKQSRQSSTPSKDTHATTVATDGAASAMPTSNKNPERKVCTRQPRRSSMPTMVSYDSAKTSGSSTSRSAVSFEQGLDPKAGTLRQKLTRRTSTPKVAGDDSTLNTESTEMLSTVTFDKFPEGTGEGLTRKHSKRASTPKMGDDTSSVAESIEMHSTVTFKSSLDSEGSTLHKQLTNIASAPKLATDDSTFVTENTDMVSTETETQSSQDRAGGRQNPADAVSSSAATDATGTKSIGTRKRPPRNLRQKLEKIKSASHLEITDDATMLTEHTDIVSIPEDPASRPRLTRLMSLPNVNVTIVEEEPQQDQLTSFLGNLLGDPSKPTAANAEEGPRKTRRRRRKQRSSVTMSDDDSVDSDINSTRGELPELTAGA